MFGISGFELLIILIFGFILVGDRLPDVAKTLGRAIRTFQSAQRDMSKVIKEDVFDPNAEDPFKDPLAALDKMGGIAKKTGSSLAGDLNEMASIAKKKKPAASNGAATIATASAKGESAETPAQNAVSADNAAGATANAGKEAPAETFAERRARYEKERAARLAAQAEQKAAEEAAAAAAAVQAADAAVSQVEAQRAEAAAPATDAPETSAADAAPTTAPSTIEGRG